MASPAPAPPVLEPVSPALEESAQRGRLAWKRLWLRLRSVTPAGLARALLVAALFSLILWLIMRAGAAMLPFWVGLILAYATLPFVNWMDRFIPRLLAVLILLGIETLILVVAVAIVVPILANEVMDIVRSLPDVNRIQEWLDRLITYLRTLPMPMQTFLKDWLRTTYADVNVNFTDYLVRFVSAGAMRAFDAARWITFLFSFLVIPNWLVYVLKDQRHAHQTIDRALPAPMRADFWGFVGVIDRTFNAFVRGRFAIAVLAALMLGVGLRLLPYLGLSEMPFPIGLPLIVGALCLIPIVGPLLAFVPIVLVGLSVSWQMAVATSLVFIGVIILSKALVLPRLESWAVDIHPALLAPIIVLGSTFGFWGAVFAGPLAVVTRDLFRYTYGRLSEPPQPAGVLPGVQPEGVATAPPQRVPLRQARPLAADRQ